MVLPNIVWLFEHDFVTFTYAFGRAKLGEPRTMGLRLGNFFTTWANFLTNLILPVIALLIFRRGGKRAAPSGFDRWFILTVALAPTALSSLFALTTGGRVMIPWTMPYYLFVTLPLVMFYRPCPGPRSLRIFGAFLIAVTVVMALIFGFDHLYRHPYLQKKHCNHNVYPGREIAAELTAEWHRRFARPCPYVIGPRKIACDMCYYSPDHPQGFFDHDIRQSQWIDPADVKKRGAVVLWNKNVPPYLEEYGARLIHLGELKYPRALPFWMRAWAPAPPEYVLNAALIPPEP